MQKKGCYSKHWMNCSECDNISKVQNLPPRKGTRKLLIFKVKIFDFEQKDNLRSKFLTSSWMVYLYYEKNLRCKKCTSSLIYRRIYRRVYRRIAAEFSQNFDPLHHSLDRGILLQKLFNCEVKNVTDLMAEHEIGFAEGKKEGHEAGLAEGREAGLAEGRAEGELKKACEMAKSLKEQGVAIAVIVKSSGLSEEEIKSL